ncbi:hypothetical protein Afil01_01060 [Actinorhabdospora filicis]|uniref:Endolytic murein transglycosylase n=1 Tax=Actinorhabdospora filicis TaxID=1785913 RepID=A0A9W6SDL7_9ACTN|nr:endolytic transglycosylase MltG [Actinorhabdospora filicis]GLZ75299.1 hypothetical protein Afil01_01060 [Actinorhabdospora filicis]
MSVLDDFARTGEGGPGRPKSHRRKRKSKTGITLVLVLVLFAGLAGGGYWAYNKIQDSLAAPDFQGTGTTEVEVTVPDGATIAEIANILFNQGVVKSAAAFVQAAQDNPESRGLQAGTYKLRKEMSGKAALDLMLSPAGKDNDGTLVPPGRAMWDVYDILAKKTGIAAEDFKKLGEDPVALGVPEEWFKRTDGKEIVKSVEGFLYPDTYQFPKDATAEVILKQMVKQFLTVTDKMDFVGNVKEHMGGLSPYEVLIIASLSQAEAGVAEDMPKIARVAYNRVKEISDKEFVTGYLEYDVTWNYGEQMAGREAKKSGDMSLDELKNPRNKWSTHAFKGLPPTPINSPGETALKGAMNPPPGAWLYFVAIDKEGHSAFADTKAEHDRNVEKAKQNGVL